MEVSPPKNQVVKFGIFEADLEQLVLTKNGLRIRLQEQPFQILGMLLEHPGDLITREQIGQRLWPANTFVEFDDGLNTAIRKLRSALGEEADNPRFIETVPRRGYRFIAPVTGSSPSPPPAAFTTHLVLPVEPAAPVSAPEELPPPVKRRFRSSRGLFALALAGALTCTAVIVLAVLYWPKPSKVPHLVRITQLTRSGAVHPNQNLATDGLRLYYIERDNGDWVLKSMPSAGGAGTRVDVPLSRYDLQDLSPDGSEMLLRRITNDADNDSLWIMSSVGGPVHRVGEMHVLGAAFSPDGRTVTYSDGSDVYLCDKDGRNPRKLFSAAGDVLRLRWSPQGDLLRFTLNDSARHTNALWEVRSNGSGMHPLLPGSAPPKWEWMMGWSHDARWFAFSAASENGRDIWLLQHNPASSGPDRIPIQLTAGPIEFDLPVFSTDNHRLYAIGLQHRGELLRFNSATHGFSPYLGGISADQLDFSRDRRWLAYVTYPEGVLWRARIDGSNALKLTDSALRVLAPKWSPDGSQMSFLARTSRGEKWQAYVVAANGGLYRRIASGADETTGASWLEDGKTMVLSSPQWDELRTLDLKSGKIAPLPGSQHLQGTLVSPSGRFLIGSSVDGTSFEILDRTIGKRQNLAQDGNYPSFSPDERCVYFNRFTGSKPGLFRVRLADMKEEKVFDLTAFQAAGSWSTWSTVAPDGSILLLRDLGGADIYAIDWQPE
jgi:DNA-binding winged helix-turn-helix (wHTH) protein/Tol biopolymer transport system component